MGHESQIELWSPNLTTFCFVGFGTDRLRRQEAMKTAGRENPKHRSTVLREHMARVGQNRSRSLKWAEKQENFQPMEMCFFLTSTFIEQIRSWPTNASVQTISGNSPRRRAAIIASNSSLFFVRLRRSNLESPSRIR